MSDKFLKLFIEKTFYNELFNKLKSYIYLHRDEIKVRSYTLSLISYKALDDFTVKEWKIHSCLEKKLYKRPSGYRKNAKETVWDKAKDEQGVVKNPITKKVMDIEEPWDMGHKPGHEFRKHQQSAADRKITRKQFLDEYNNPNSYRPELPESHRSHIGEDKMDFILVHDFEERNVLWNMIKKR